MKNTTYAKKNHIIFIKDFSKIHFQNAGNGILEP